MLLVEPFLFLGSSRFACGAALSSSSSSVVALRLVVLVFFLLVVEVELEDGVAGRDFAGLHLDVDSAGHLEHPVLVARVDYCVENVCIEETERLLLTLFDHLKKLVCPEKLLFFLLLPEGPAPHQDPAQVHVDTFISCDAPLLFETCQLVLLIAAFCLELQLRLEIYLLELFHYEAI